MLVHEVHSQHRDVDVVDTTQGSDTPDVDGACVC
jgi:hypothetical protein